MQKKIMYIVLVIVIVVGAAYSYKRVDFGRKTTVFFKIVFGDQNNMMRMPPKERPPGENGAFKPPTDFEGRGEGRFGDGDRGGQGPPERKEMPGKPGMRKIISLRNVIPYTFILAFFVLITRVLDFSIRKTLKSKSSV